MIDEQKFHKTNSGHYPATFDFLGIKVSSNNSNVIVKGHLIFIHNDTKLSRWNPYIQEHQGWWLRPCALFLEVS